MAYNYILLTILSICCYCESVTILKTNEQFNTPKHQTQINYDKNQNCFIKCRKNQNCFNDITSNSFNSCNDLTIQSQYASSLILELNQYEHPNLNIYLPSKMTSTNNIYIYSQSEVVNSNTIQLYCNYNKTSHQYISSCILSKSTLQCLDTNHKCNKQIQIQFIYNHNQHNRNLLSLSSTSQPTISPDSQTGFMKLLNKAKQINFIFYIIIGLVLSICCVTCCCLYYVCRTHKTARQIKKLSIVKPNSPISPSETYNNTVVTNTSVYSPQSGNSQMTAISNIKSDINTSNINYDEKDKDNESAEETYYEPKFLNTIHTIHTSNGSKRSIQSMDVDDIEISHITNSKKLHSTNEMSKSNISKSGIDYNNPNKFVMNHNVNNTQYIPQQQQQQIRYTQSQQQQHQQQYTQPQLIQNHHSGQHPHRNTITMPNSNINSNNWNNNNRNNAIQHPHRNTVAVMTNIHNNNNNWDNNWNNNNNQMHINIIPPQQQSNNSNSNNNNIPPPPPEPIIPKQNMNLIPTIINDDNCNNFNDNGSDITHITSSTLASLNTEDFENDNSDSVSSSEISNKHKQHQTMNTIHTHARMTTYATHTGTESASGGEDTHNIIEPLDNDNDNNNDNNNNELGSDDAKQHVIKYNEGNITDVQTIKMMKLSVQNSGHSVDDDGQMYMKLQANFQYNNESVLALDNEPSAEHSLHSHDHDNSPQHMPHQNNQTMVIKIDANNDIQKSYSYDSYQL